MGADWDTYADINTVVTSVCVALLVKDFDRQQYIRIYQHNFGILMVTNCSPLVCRLGLDSCGIEYL